MLSYRQVRIGIPLAFSLGLALAQPVTSSPDSESNAPRADMAGVPDMSCKNADSSSWDKCVGIARYPNGNIYRGEFHHGRRDGFGFIMINASGVSNHNNILSNEPAIYAGEFRDDRLNGHGVWFAKSGAAYYGRFTDNIPQTDLSQSSCSGALSPSWSNCVARVAYGNGNVYYGEFMHGRREGIGMLEIHETGISSEANIRTPAPGVYVGEFKDDRLNGQGMVFMPSGGGFFGVFRNNIFSASLPAT
jgi:hypothetical protein